MKKLLTVFSLVILAKIGLACSCYPYQPNFFKNVSSVYNCIAVFDTMDYSYVYNDLPGQTGHFILLDTIGHFNSDIGDTIIVTGQDGLNCGETLTRFSPGDTVFLALSKGFYETYEKDTFYLEGFCGKHFLKIKNGQYAGLTIPEIKAKIYNVLERNAVACFCSDFWDNMDFYSNVSKASLNCLVVFNGYNYSYSFDGLNSQTGYFKLIDTIGTHEGKIGDTIIVTGEDGINCGEILSRFSPGDTLFLALSDGYYESFEKDTFYLEGGTCGVHFLKISNGQNREMSISDIKDRIISKITGTGEMHIEQRVKLFPNPATDVITIEAADGLILNVKIYNMSGQLVTSFDNINNFNIDIDLKNFKSGLYHIFIETRDGTIMHKFVRE